MVTIPILSQISLVPGVPRVDVHTEVDNLAKDHRLRVHFPAPFTVDQGDYDGHFEVVRRPVGIPKKGDDWVEDPRPEVPQRAFTDISNGAIGLTIANRGLPEVDVVHKNTDRAEIALTLLRSVGWLSRDDMSVREGHAGPAMETPGGQVPGEQNYDYAIIPHQGIWQAVFQRAYSFETSLVAIETRVHAGELPCQGSFIAHTPAEFVISAVKETEYGRGWLLRGYNISGETIQLNLKPLRMFDHVSQINLAEEEISPLNLEADGSLVMPVSGHEIVSILFRDPIPSV